MSNRSRPKPGAPSGPATPPLLEAERPGSDEGLLAGPRLTATPAQGQGPARRRRRRARVWPWALLLLLLAAGSGLGWWFWSGAAEPPPSVLTATVTRGDIEDSTMALGTLQPLDYVDVGAQVSGQLRSLYVELGDQVEQGELLAEIDPSLFESRVAASRAQLANLKAQLADRQAQLTLARQQYQRQTKLMAAQATSEDALQSAQAATASAAAQVEALKAQIENSESELQADETNLGYSEIYAPLSGTVVSQEAKQGQTLNANQQAPIILRIADLSTMTVTTQVSEADIGRLEPGMTVYFSTLGRPDRRWESRLRKILPTPEVVNNVVLYNALFDVPNPSGELMTQMTAQVFFVSARAEDTLVVPVGALQEARGGQGREGARDGGGDPAGERKVGRAAGGYAVQVKRPDGTLERRPVKVGIVTRVSAEILEGLSEGEEVVVGTERQGGERESRGMRGPRLS